MRKDKEMRMSKVAVVYWSGTGNTEAMAEAVAEGVREAGAEAEVIQAVSFGPERVDEFDAFAFGCSDQGDEELEAFDFLPMYDAVEPVVGPDKKVLLFGSYGAWNNAEWMDDWKARADEANLNVIDTLIAVDYPDDDALAECRDAGKRLA